MPPNEAVLLHFKCDHVFIHRRSPVRERPFHLSSSALHQLSYDVMANNYNINNNTSGMGGNIIADPVAAAIHARARSPSLRKLRRRRRGF